MSPRQPLALLLLFVLSVVLVPKSWWHACEDLDHRHWSPGELAVVDTTTDDCAICDFELPAFAPEWSDADPAPATYPGLILSLPSAAPMDAALRLGSTRGPPALT